MPPEMLSPTSGVASAPAVERRLTSRVGRLFDIGWMVVTAAAIIVGFMVGGFPYSWLWALVLLIAVIGSCALMVTVSRVDTLLTMGIAPALLVVAADTLPPVAALTLWAAGFLVGAIVRTRGLRHTFEFAGYLIVAGIVALAVWIPLDAAGVHIALAAPATVVAFIATRIATSMLRLAVATRMTPRAIFGSVLWGRVAVVSVVVAGALYLGLSIARFVNTTNPQSENDPGGVAAFAVLGVVTFGIGMLLELRTATTRLTGMLDAALALPWSPSSSVEEHARHFAQRTLPRESIEVRGDGEVAENEIAAKLPEGNLVARRGSTQGPFVVKDRRVLEAIAHIAETMANTRTEQARLAREAFTDDLTGLPNYRAFRIALDELPSTHPGTRFAVVYLDVDNFKDVNDAHGHEVGNAVLQLVATRLRAHAGADDIVARVGGDEFVVILTGVTDDLDADRRTERLLTEVSAPIVLGQTIIGLSMSRGLAVAAPGTPDATALVEAADARMYAARGRDVEPVSDATMPIAVTRGGGDPAELVEAIADAVRHRRLTLVYQPIVDRVENTIIAMEALIRPSDAALRGVPAGILVHEARRLGLLTELSRHVVDTAITDMQRFQTIAPSLTDVHVNVDVEQITDVDFATAVSHARDTESVTVTLELSETSLQRSSEDTIAMLEDLRREGSIPIALDDFGQAASTLLSVVQYPFDVLKVDRALTLSLRTRKSQLVMRSLALLTRNLRVQMVVEGVETQQEYDDLVKVGVRYMQGYRFGRGIPVAEMMARLEAHGLTAYLDDDAT
ncbi:EAL domain-containing protein [Microbacterium sp. bgisy189]|uniref:putative bifunctional diguanylate cyclase/phosphodiesterase n=1 Tax=Microbacterium sp. bgisy189 TaxID=3413798 RepID=UPI003EBF2A00